MQISDLFPDILRLRPHYLCSRCFGSSQQGHLGGASRRWTCTRCQNDVCLKCYPEEPTAEQPALTATRPGARLESGGKDGEEEKEEPEVAEEAALKLSKGSAQHLPGSCKPCLYVVTPAGCSLGVNCEFCHEPACRRKRRARPSKTTRMQCKQLVARLDDGQGEDASQVARAAQTMAADSAYMRSILAAKGRQHPVQAQKAPTGSDQGAQGGATQSREPQPPALREPQGPPAQSSAQRRDSPDPHDASPVGAPSARRA